MDAPPLPEPTKELEEAWPAPEYYPHQRRIYREAAAALFDDNDFDTVIIDAPTGVGKSVINTALCNLADTAFYTTPQKELRRQLEDDRMLGDEFSVLRARNDYYPCDEAYNRASIERNCSNCPINQASDHYYVDQLPREEIRGIPESDLQPAYHTGITPVACSAMDECTYWMAKTEAMENSVAVLTFAYLITDNFLPKWTEYEIDGRMEGRRISFGDRELLVVDEAHSLEGQVASMFAGFTVGSEVGQVLDDVKEAVPDNLLREVFDPDYTAPLGDHVVSQTVLDGLLEAVATAEKLLTGQISIAGLPELDEELPETLEGSDPEFDKFREDLESFKSSVVRHLGTEFDQEHPWVVDVEEDGDSIKFSFQPVKVDQFLRENVWSRADKIVLSSATIPAYGSGRRSVSAKRWAERIGLDPQTTHVISVPSPFPVENRPIDLTKTVGKMSHGRFDERIDEVADQIRALAEKHSGEKGLIHTSSYSQAGALGDRLNDIAIVHHREESGEVVLNRWKWSEDGGSDDRDVLISPSLSEGVDLPDEMCRWQAVVKVPYADVRSSRVRYRLDKMKDWDWYKGEAALSMVQAAGRGVRHDEDECVCYVTDTAFLDVCRYTPEWFQEAIVD